MLTRREFLIGTTAVAAIMALPAVAMDDPLVAGIRWQSWPWQQPRPKFYVTGSIGNLGKYTGDLRPLSSYMDHIESLRPIWPKLVWKPIV